MTNKEIGFIYYLAERRLTTSSYIDFGKKIETLKKEYDKKYPNGLTDFGQIIKFK